MTALTLRLRERPRQRIDMAGFTPERLEGKHRDAVAQIPIWQGNRQIPAGELFAITGEDPDHIVVQSDSDRLDGIGTGMTRGEILVEGRAGAYLGREMRGGEVHVKGDAGVFAGSGMSGGMLRIDGDADDFLGAAVSGERRGMRGGRIHVKGRAGDRVGDHQRRGIVLIEGDAGDYCGSRMVAGTIVVLGAVGAAAGLAMHRGTLLLAREPELPPTFNDNGVHDLGFLSLLAGDLRHYDGPFSCLQERGIRVRRWLGDLACNGKGEVLVWS
jgi:formylmethanofuran dehydrogenase subunit C